MKRSTHRLLQEAHRARMNILDMAHRTKSGHIGSALSITDILTVLYFDVLKVQPADPFWPRRDRFILSKGHAAAALYAVLAARGFFAATKLRAYLADGEVFSVHPTAHHIPGVELSTGSLGHGLSVGVGMALASSPRMPYRAVVLVSDAECDEGSTWEAALSAAQFQLDNLTVIVDYNKSQAFGKTHEVMNLEPLAKKWESFGFAVREVDGHDIPRLRTVLASLPFKKGKPNAVVAHTSLGKGVSFMEDKLEWHYLTMSDDQFESARSELESRKAV